MHLSTSSEVFLKPTLLWVEVKFLGKADRCMHVYMVHMHNLNITVIDPLTPPSTKELARPRDPSGSDKERGW